MTVKFGKGLHNLGRNITLTGLQTDVRDNEKVPDYISTNYINITP